MLCFCCQTTLGYVRATGGIAGHNHAFIATGAVIVHAAAIVQASANTHAAVVTIMHATTAVTHAATIYT